MSLQDRLDALKVNFEAKTPLAAVAAMRRAVEQLLTSEQASHALRAGDRAPPFTLAAADGHAVSLAGLLRRGPLVVTFYRGLWCPYCNLDLQALEAAARDIRARGGSLLAVSPQTPANSRKSRRNNKLSFPILVDPGGEVANDFGLRWILPEELRAVYRQLGVDLRVFNGENSWTLPMPARYVIAPDGIIAYAEINPDYTRRPEPSELLPTLEGLRRGGA